MRLIIALIFIFIRINLTNCQDWKNRICINTVNQDIVEDMCEVKSKFDLRFEVSILNKIPNEITRNWIGSPFGFIGGIWVAYSKINFGICINTIPTKTHQELFIDNQILPSNERIVLYSFDFLTSYSINLKNNFSFEPIFGYTFGSITSISNDIIRIPDFNGFYIGSALNKYFKIEKDEYASLFASLGYGFADYSTINKELGFGYFKISIGLALKVTHYKKSIRSL